MNNQFVLKRIESTSAIARVRTYEAVVSSIIVALNQNHTLELKFNDKLVIIDPNKIVNFVLEQNNVDSFV